jgi:tRNA(Ile)-lysidine synthase
LAEPEAVLAYLEQHQIPHVEDSTNQSDFCLRNRLRHRVIPLLTEENPSLSGAASRLCLQLGQEDRYLQAQAESALEAILGPEGLRCSGLLALAPHQALRVLGLYLKAVPQLQAVHLEAALGLCRRSSPSARLSLPGGYTLCRSYDHLALETGTIPVPQPATIFPGETVAFGPWQVSCQRGPMPAQPVPGTQYLPGALAPLTLRPRRAGDKIQLSQGHKKLSRLMIDEKIPARLRDTLPVVCQGDTVLAVLPLRSSCCPQPGSDSLHLTAKRMEEPS